MPLLKKKDKKEKEEKLDKDGNPILEEDAEDGVGNKVVMVLVTLLIILVWLAIIGLLIKTDFGGFGSTFLRPIIKDIPYLNMILPENEDLPEDTQYQYETIDDAVVRIKELEALLDTALAANGTDAETISQLNAQIAELQVYKAEQAEFEEIKEKFYEEVVFSEEAPALEEYKAFYESIDPENAEVLYKQTIEQIEYNNMVDDYAKTYSTMKPKEAAAIFDTMTDNLDLVADILLSMDTQSRADIMGKMEPENAAKLTAIMEPDN